MQVICLLLPLLLAADEPPANAESKSEPAAAQAAAAPPITSVKELLAAAEAERKQAIDRLTAELKNLPKAKLPPDERAQRAAALKQELAVTRNQAGKAPAMVYKVGHAGEIDPDTVDIRVEQILAPDAAIVDVTFFQVSKRLVGGKLIPEGKPAQIARRTYIMRPLDTKTFAPGARVPPPRYCVLGPQEEHGGKKLLVLSPLKP